MIDVMAILMDIVIGLKLFLHVIDMMAMVMEVMEKNYKIEAVMHVLYVMALVMDHVIKFRL